MFQCLGLGTCEDGGCGEDWWHPECLVGFTREEYSKMIEKPKSGEKDAALDTTKTDSPVLTETETNGHTTESAPAPTTTTAAVTGPTNGGIDWK